jgi:ribosome-associated protein
VKEEPAKRPAPKNLAEQQEAARKFAIEAARLAQNTRCHGVVVLDMIGLSPVTDFYIIATGTSARQMRSVVDDIDELAEAHGFGTFHRSGYEGETWIAVDYVDVVVHLFSQDARLYYDLENLWGDAKKVEWKQA